MTVDTERVRALLDRLRAAEQDLTACASPLGLNGPARPERTRSN